MMAFDYILGNNWCIWQMQMLGNTSDIVSVFCLWIGEYQVKKCLLSAEATQDLLICFLWVLKNIDERFLRSWWSDVTPVRLAQVLEVLYVCESNFEYKVLLNCCCLLMCCAVYMKTVACTGCVAIVVVDINVDRGAEYCDERFCLCVCARVCVFVCPRSRLRNYRSDLHQIFSARYLWAWLRCPLVA